MHTIYLHAAEKHAFDSLPETLKEGWEVKEETSNAYETAEALSIRANMSRFSKHPAVQKFLKKAQDAKSAEDLALDDIPEDLLPTFFFTIGARGIGAFIATLLSRIKTDEDVQGLCGLSQIRHDILEANGAIQYV